MTAPDETPRATLREDERARLFATLSENAGSVLPMALERCVERLIASRVAEQSAITEATHSVTESAQTVTETERAVLREAICDGYFGDVCEEHAEQLEAVVAAVDLIVAAARAEGVAQGRVDEREMALAALDRLASGSVYDNERVRKGIRIAAAFIGILPLARIGGGDPS